MTAGPGRATVSAPHVTISLARRLAFRFFALLGLPALVFIALELGLRAGGYGYRATFFLPSTIDGQEVRGENARFGLRFFPAALARSPSPVVMTPRKAPGTIRIFLFGESAALGDPSPGYGPGRWLEVLLRERFPKQKFEVVCVAMTAINSHAVRLIARECARYDGDLWVVYMGNNELMGPFGVSPIFGSVAPNLAVARASLGLKATRLGQWLTSTAERIGGRSRPNQVWKGMGMFMDHLVAPDAPSRDRIHRHFASNLDDLLAAATKARVKVVVSSVASNLRDSPPFASLPAAGLGTAEAREWRKRFAAGTNLQAQGSFLDALGAYESAQRLDPWHAELRFRMGQCALALTNRALAISNFVAARDSDALPFRAVSELNEIARRTAARFSERGVAWCDSEKTFARLSPDGVPGGEWFYEHVHFKPEGSYRLAVAWADAAQALLPREATAETASADWASFETCGQRLALNDWNRHEAFQHMLGRQVQAPFTNQLGHAQRLRALAEEAQASRARLHPNTILDVRALFEENLRQWPKDIWLVRGFAELLDACGETEEAIRRWQDLTRLVPHHELAWFQAGRLLNAVGKPAEAVTALQESIRRRPDVPEAHLTLGQAYSKLERLDDAMHEYGLAHRLAPDDARVPFRRAEVYQRLKQRERALDQLREAIRLRPSYWEARYFLGVEMALDEKLPEAEEQFREVARLKPDYILGRLNLGVSLARRGQWTEAEREFQAVLALDPDNARARQHLDMLRQISRGAAGDP